MECPNQTAPNEFILAGLSYQPELKLPLVLFFSIMFILTLSGNALIIWVVISDHQLHKPMYWFLCNISILDMAFSSVVVPKAIAGFFPGGKAISFEGCVSQLFSFHFIGRVECVLYTVMAYDRFLAICKPLHYGNIMSWKACRILSLGTVIGGCLNSSFLTSLTFHLPYGENNYIDYVFCDTPAILKLSCATTKLNNFMILVNVALVGLICFLLIIASYIYIFSAIFRISSSEGWQRAFSTCIAHIIVVIMYYVPLSYHYLRPISKDSMDDVVSIFYTTLTPLLNPLIYTFRNKEMKSALRKMWGGYKE